MPVPMTTGQLRTNVADMQIGDYIACSVKMADPTRSASALLFGKLGMDNPVELLSATAGKVYGDSVVKDSKFYFIKVDVGTLVADRVLQNYGQFLNYQTTNLMDGRYSPNLVYPSAERNMRNVYTLTSPFSIADEIAYYGATWETKPWIQFDYLYPKTITAMKLLTRAASAGYEPVKNFTIIGSNDGFLNSTEILKAVNQTPTVEQEYLISPKGKFKSYRLLMDDFYGDNGGDGQTVSKVIFTTLETTKDIHIRMMTGGAIYIDADGSTTTANKGLGNFPTNNEYDKYIGRFPAELIKPGSGIDDVFHCDTQKTGNPTCVKDMWLNNTSLCQGRYHRDGEPAVQTGAHNAALTGGIRPIMIYEEER